MNKNELKVLKNLLDRPEKEWTVKDMSETTGISKPTVWRIFDKYSKKDVLREKRVGRSKLFSVGKKRYIKKIVTREDPASEYLKDIALDFVKEASELKEVNRIVLYGSVARGSASLKSDIDLFVVVKSKDVESHLYSISSDISEEEGAPVVLDIVTEEEFEKLEKRNDPFIKTLNKYGEVLYERTS